MKSIKLNMLFAVRFCGYTHIDVRLLWNSLQNRFQGTNSLTASQMLMKWFDYMTNLLESSVNHKYLGAISA